MEIIPHGYLLVYPSTEDKAAKELEQHISRELTKRGLPGEKDEPPAIEKVPVVLYMDRPSTLEEAALDLSGKDFWVAIFYNVLSSINFGLACKAIAESKSDKYFVYIDSDEHMREFLENDNVTYVLYEDYGTMITDTVSTVKNFIMVEAIKSLTLREMDDICGTPADG
jgi:hypothetical protein